MLDQKQKTWACQKPELKHLPKTALPFELYSLTEFFSFCVYILSMWKSHSNCWLSEFNFPLFCLEGLAIANVQICKTKYMFAWHFLVRNMRPITRYHYWVTG